MSGSRDVTEDLARTFRGNTKFACVEATPRVSGRSGGVDDGRNARGEWPRGANRRFRGDAGGGARDHALGATEEVDRHNIRGPRVHRLGLLGGGREDADHVRVGEDVLDLGSGV